MLRIHGSPTKPPPSRRPHRHLNTASAPTAPPPPVPRSHPGHSPKVPLTTEPRHPWMTTTSSARKRLQNSKSAHPDPESLCRAVVPGLHCGNGIDFELED